jgi:hypothetical protein
MELRLYCFVDWMLSSIQQGIQTGHAAVDLVRKYPRNAMVSDWADNHKTFIILNGGDYEGVREALRITSETKFPFVPFYESKRANGGRITCVAVVLPETVFNAAPFIDTSYTPSKLFRHVDEKTGDEIVYASDHKLYEFLTLLKGCALAR